MKASVRTVLRPGDVGAVVTLHGVLYAREYGFDPTFEAYVAGPLAAFVLRGSPRERIWLAEHDDHLIGCVAIVADSPGVAQLRWFLVAPDARGAGLGRRLLEEAVAFSRAEGYERIILWTVSALERAARLYRSANFRRVEAVAGDRWGVAVIEEKYELDLGRGVTLKNY
jgi:GNAT superfamily N-acetyltransferase